MIFVTILIVAIMGSLPAASQETMDTTGKMDARETMDQRETMDPREMTTAGVESSFENTPSRFEEPQSSLKETPLDNLVTSLRKWMSVIEGTCAPVKQNLIMSSC